MITQSCNIYVIDRGFVSPDEVSPGDKVYVLDGFDVKVKSVEAVHSDFISDRIYRIDSGQHNVVITSDALSLYYSEVHGFKYLRFEDIPSHTRDKTYQANKYLPVLSWPAPGKRKCSNVELETLARMILVHRYERDLLDDIMSRCTGSDCLALVDLLEFWCSESPGEGWFDRAQVKARTHRINDPHFRDELAKAAVLAGYTAAFSEFSPRKYGLRINYESMPIPGSRPKTEKYYYTYYTGMVYSINAGNLPILGSSLGRVFYLPTRSDIINYRY